MRKWLYDRPWIWIVVLLGLLVGSGLTTLVIAELNRPEIVKEACGTVAIDRNNRLYCWTEVEAKHAGVARSFKGKPCEPTRSAHGAGLYLKRALKLSKVV